VTSPVYQHYTLTIDGDPPVSLGRVFIVWVETPSWPIARAERRTDNQLRTIALLYMPKTVALGPGDRHMIRGVTDLDTGATATWILTESRNES
jgi:hypothetical protein